MTDTPGAEPVTWKRHSGYEDILYETLSPMSTSRLVSLCVVDHA